MPLPLFLCIPFAASDSPRSYPITTTAAGRIAEFGTPRVDFVANVIDVLDTQTALLSLQPPDRCGSMEEVTSGNGALPD